MAYTTIEVHKLGEVGKITLNRESARNAQNTELLDELDDAFDFLERDEGVKVIVLAANGPHFSAGHDLREGAARRPNPTVESRWVHEETKFFGYCLRIWDCDKPTIALVQGGCIAAGFMVANMCDLIVASESAYFSDPVVHTLSTASVEVLIHPWVMGLRKAKEMLFTGERLAAGEAHRIGLVNRVVPDADLNAEGLALAQQIAKAQPFALKLTKRSLNRSLDVQGLRTALNAHFDTHQLSHRTEEHMSKRRGGVDASLKKAG
ncbi:MAG: enoyl-CoA hydratase [Lautropia sp.]